MPAHASAQPGRAFTRTDGCPCRAGLGAGGEWGQSLAASFREGVHALDGGVPSSTQRPESSASLPAGTSSSGPRRCVLDPSADARTQRGEGWDGGDGCSGHATSRSATLLSGVNTLRDVDSIEAGTPSTSAARER